MISLHLSFAWIPITLFSSAKAIMDQLSFSPWLFLIPIIGIIVTYLLLRLRKDQTEIEEELESSAQGSAFIEALEVTRYAGGHPLLNDLVQPCVLSFESESLHLNKYFDEQRNTVVSLVEIPKDSIVELKIEDSFTMMKKMTSERWQQVSKHFQGLENSRDEDVAFLVIVWQYELTDQCTYFSIESPGNAMEYALRKRNTLLKSMRNPAFNLAMAI